MRESEGVNEGLEGVVVAATRLSDVDGERGRLVIAGRDVELLAVDATFEHACALLWQESDPGALRKQLGLARAAAFPVAEQVFARDLAADGMDALRTAVAALPSRGDPADAPAAVGAMPVFAAAWARRSRGLAPVAPDASLGHAADFLRMVTGEAPSADAVRALDTYLVTVCDHGMNASTFAARVIASTGSDLVSAVTGAIGALKGPLHGGAPGPVLDMLDAIGEPSRAEAWLLGELDAGRRIMGMGHRIYRVRDPRAAVLEGAVERLERAGLRTSRLALARAVERAAVGLLKARRPGRALQTNVEFYTAVLLDTLGLPRALFTPAFAVGRVAGWAAHVVEQRASGRIVRPASRYVGPAPEPTRALEPR